MSSKIGEVGYKTIRQDNAKQWHTVNLQQTYIDPVVVMGPASYNGDQPLTIRVKNFTPNSFQFQIDEWEYLDGAHTNETIGYLVIEAGIHEFGDGERIAAGAVKVDHNWATVSFGKTFPQTPVVFSQCASCNAPDPVVTRQRNITESSFVVRLQEEEYSSHGGIHAMETVMWIAIQQGKGASQDISFVFGVTPQNITHEWHTISWDSLGTNRPVLLAAMQTFAGSNAANLRYRNLTQNSVSVFVEEETSANSEVVHTKEQVGYAVFSESGIIYKSSIAIAPGDVLVNVDFSALPEPFKELAQKLQDAINSEVEAPKGDIKLTADLLGSFSLFGNLFGLDSLTIMTIKDAQLQVVGEVGVDLSSQEATGKLGLKLSGTSSMFGTDLVQTTAVFFLNNAGKPVGIIKMTPPESAGSSWGIGQVFPSIPVVAAMRFDSPAIVLSSEDAEDEELDFGIAEGFNYYGNIAVVGTSDDMLNFIGGLFGVDKLSMHGAIAKTNAGPKYILEAAVDQEVAIIPGDIFNMEFEGSEIALQIVAGEPTITIASNMMITMKWTRAEELLFTGAIKAEPESITGSFTLNKPGSGGQEWHKPFGIPGIVIRNLAVQMGLTYAPPWIDNIGIAGDMKIGTIDASMAILLDVNDPDQFVLSGRVSQITLLEIMSALSPYTFAAYQALPRSILDAMNKVVNVKLTGVDQDGVVINIVPVATQIGALDFNDEGITLEGKLVAWGWGAHAHINVSPSDILIDAAMDAINLGGVFKFTGSGGNANPQLHLQVSTTADPELYVSGRIDLLGIKRDLKINATKEGLEFRLTDRISDILTLDQTCVLADNRLDTRGTIRFILNMDVGPIIIAGVTVADRIHLKGVAFNASAQMQVTAAPSFNMTVGGRFKFHGRNLTMPDLTLSISPNNFRGVCDAVQNQIRSQASGIFSKLFSNGQQWAKAVAEGFIDFTGNVANVLKEGFKEPAESAAKIMKNTMGKGVNEIAKGLQSTYKISADEAANVLKRTGYVADEVAGALRYGYDLSANGTARALKYAGYGINEVGGAVGRVYKLSKGGVASALKGAGYAANEVGNFMKNTYKLGDKALRNVLEGAGYAANEVRNFVGDIAEDISGKIEDTGRKIEDKIKDWF